MEIRNSKSEIRKKKEKTKETKPQAPRPARSGVFLFGSSFEFRIWDFGFIR
jgi:hypothetical protein